MDTWRPIRDARDLPLGRDVIVSKQERTVSWARLVLDDESGEVMWRFRDDEGCQPFDYVLAWMPKPEAYDPDAERACVISMANGVMRCQCGEGHGGPREDSIRCLRCYRIQYTGSWRE